MKRILIALFLCLFAFRASAWNPMVVTSGSSSAVACSAATDYVGDKTDHSASFAALIDNQMYCVSYQATTAACASGTLGKAYMAHHGTETDVAKVLVYTDSTSGTGEPNNETLLGESAEISCNTDTPTPTCTAGGDLGGAITKNAYYFICSQSNNTQFDVHRTAAGPSVLWYKALWDYDNPAPNPLTPTGWTEATRDWGVYVEIK